MSYKVMVVDDSAFMRKIITDIISEDENLEVIETAKNGREAIKKIQEVKPDLITLDVEMPIMNGIETLEELHKINLNIPVLMLSSLTKAGADLTIKAFEMGAIDFIAKPSSIFSLNKERNKEQITAKINSIISSKGISNTNINTKSIVHTKKYSTDTTSDIRIKNIIAIGCSTGGPRALQAIIPKLPYNINSTLVVVQHMPPGFTKSLSERLNKISTITVKEAEDGEVMKNSACYIAPGDKHLLITENKGNLKIKLSDGINVNGHKPSVDILMNSVHELSNINKIGIILTGMGSDGSEGIKKLHDSGNYTIGQNEKTCVVYGMPKSANAIGGIDKELNLDDIASEIKGRVGCI